MSKRILIDSSDKDEIRVAVTTNVKLDDFEIETSKKNALKGDVYLAKITRVEPSFQVAFVDFSVNRNGFLTITEIHPDYLKIPITDQEKIKDMVKMEIASYTKKKMYGEGNTAENILRAIIKIYN